MQIYGGFAFSREYDIERKWRKARLYQTAPISTKLIIAYISASTSLACHARIERDNSGLLRRSAAPPQCYPIGAVISARRTSVVRWRQ